ncbi:MAG: PEP/pyruvate-binding domain-containing protein [Chloroflexota bacterium]
MTIPLIIPLTSQNLPKQVGGKAAQVHYLQQQGQRVPHSFVCDWVTYEQSLVDKTAVLATLRQALSQHLDLDKSYAVRSSANVEDAQAYSFAGQFESVLDVRGLDNLLTAVQTVWNSAQAETLQPYLEKAGLKQDDLKMAVLIQEMVPPVVSGVAFSKNPMTGTDEIIVEAVQGSGEKLVQEGVTPERWVYKWGDWLIQPATSEIELAIIEDVVAQTKEMAKAYGAPIDLEWVWDGTAVYWVQLRPITTAQNLNIYSNRISREVLPGIIKPLIWSINVPMVNSAWIDLFTEMIGPNDIEPDDLSKAFHYRAYFNMATIGRVFTALGMPTETLELMMGMEGGDEKPRFKPSGQTYRHLPRMIRFGWDKFRFARKIDAFLPKMTATYRQFAQTNLAKLDEHELLAEVDRLAAFTKEAAYYNIVGPLLMAVYNNMLQKRIEKLGVDFVQFDLMNGVNEWEKYDPTVHLANLHEQFSTLPETVQACIRQSHALPQLNGIAQLTDLQQEIAKFVEQFGHFSNSGNDFSAVPWRENQSLVVQMIANFVVSENERSKVTWEELPLGAIGRWRHRGVYKRARQFRLYREIISFWYTFGYGLFRNLMLTLGERLSRRGLLHQRDDIFYLYLDEVKQAVFEPSGPKRIQDLVAKRKAEIEAVQDIVLPDTVFGDDPPPPETAVQQGNQLTGIPTSRGYYRGQARIIQNIEEFGKMQVGDIIVIPYSDVAWTPLFAKAGAVIAESGGMLSHSSIVAREYNLPAVVSVNGACRHIQDGMMISVDGFRGEILLYETEEVA